MRLSEDLRVIATRSMIKLLCRDHNAAEATRHDVDIRQPSELNVSHRIRVHPRNSNRSVNVFIAGQFFRNLSNT